MYATFGYSGYRKFCGSDPQAVEIEIQFCLELLMIYQRP